MDLTRICTNVCIIIGLTCGVIIHACVVPRCAVLCCVPRAVGSCCAVSLCCREEGPQVGVEHYARTRQEVRCPPMQEERKVAVFVRATLWPRLASRGPGRWDGIHVPHLWLPATTCCTDRPHTHCILRKCASPALCTAPPAAYARSGRAWRWPPAAVHRRSANKCPGPRVHSPHVR